MLRKIHTGELIQPQSHWHIHTTQHYRLGSTDIRCSLKYREKFQTIIRSESSHSHTRHVVFEEFHYRKNLYTGTAMVLYTLISLKEANSLPKHPISAISVWEVGVMQIEHICAVSLILHISSTSASHGGKPGSSEDPEATVCSLRKPYSAIKLATQISFSTKLSGISLHLVRVRN